MNGVAGLLGVSATTRGPGRPKRKVVRKVPYYLRSICALGRIATAGSLVRCVLTPRKRLELRDGHTLLVTSALDLLVLKETLVDDVYGLAALDARDGVIVDVGAGIGSFALAAATRFPHLEVHAFEPSPETFQALEANARSRGLGNLRLSSVAVGVNAGYVLFSSGPRATAVTGSGERDGGVVVPARRLDGALDDSPIRLLKIDCEGLELDVLRSATGLLDRIDRIVAEYHLHLAPGSDRLLVEFARSHGFDVWIERDPYDDRIGLVHAMRAAPMT